MRLVDIFIPWFCFKPCYIHWKNPHHCAVLGYICLASTLGLSLLFPRFTGARTKHLKPVVSRMWKLKCFHRRSEDQLRTEALHLHRTHYKHRTCCGSSVTRKIESCMALHLSWLSGPVCILNSLTNRDFAVGAITPFGISLSCSGGRKTVSDQSRITSKRDVRSYERFLSDL